MILGVPPRPGLRMLASKPDEFRERLDSLEAPVTQALVSAPQYRRGLYSPLQTIGSAEIADLGRLRAMPRQQAIRERHVHLAAGA